MAIDLKAILRQQGRKKPLELRAIQTTQAQMRSLARLYYPVVDVWTRGVKERILPEYARTIATFTGDSPADIEAEIAAVDGEAVRVTFDFRAFLQEWAAGLLRWHIDRIGQQLTYATDLDLTGQLGPAGETVEDFLARNTALIRDVSDQTRGRIADIVFRGVQQRTPVRDVAREIAKATGLARDRSTRIASDQTVKLSAALDELRGRELSFDGYYWQHSGKVHYRPAHLERERSGTFFPFGSPIDQTDPPGYAPFCGCKRRLAMAPVEQVETVEIRNDRLNSAQRNYVLDKGRTSGNEFLSAFDEASGEILGRKTDDLKGFVGFTPELEAAMADAGRRITVRHNHPSSGSLSKPDILMLGEFKGMSRLYADGHNGSEYLALRGKKRITQTGLDRLERSVDSTLRKLTGARRIDAEGARLIRTHLVNLRYARSGFIDYTYTLTGDRLSAADKYADLIQDVLKWTD